MKLKNIGELDLYSEGDGKEFTWFVINNNRKIITQYQNQRDKIIENKIQLCVIENPDVQIFGYVNQYQIAAIDISNCSLYVHGKIIECSNKKLPDKIYPIIFKRVVKQFPINKSNILTKQYFIGYDSNQDFDFYRFITILPKDKEDLIIVGNENEDLTLIYEDILNPKKRGE